jgi:hypothetical protein
MLCVEWKGKLMMTVTRITEVKRKTREERDRLPNLITEAYAITIMLPLSYLRVDFGIVYHLLKSSTAQV